MYVEKSYDWKKTWKIHRYFSSDCSKDFPGIHKGWVKVSTGYLSIRSKHVPDIRLRTKGGGCRLYQYYISEYGRILIRFSKLGRIRIRSELKVKIHLKLSFLQRLLSKVINSIWRYIFFERKWDPNSGISRTPAFDPSTPRNGRIYLSPPPWSKFSICACGYQGYRIVWYRPSCPSSVLPKSVGLGWSKAFQCLNSRL